MRSRTLLLVLVVLVLVGAGAYALRRLHVIGPGPSVTIGVDLPYQGDNNAISTATFNAMKLYLDQHGDKVGDISVSLFSYDDATSTNPTGDDTKCADNARTQIARSDLIAVIGPQQVACARVEAKALAAANMVLVSPAVTNPGLTKAWQPGEPAAYTANGARSFARVVPTDDQQGSAAALFAAQTAKVKNCLVLNDGEVYGQQLAQSFSTTAKANGIAITDLGTWDKGASSYLATFAGMEGTDCVYLAGNYDNNGAQLVSDKVALLGDNDHVKLFVPDGFGLYPAFLQSPAGQHAYTTTPGLTMDAWRSLKGTPATFLTAYHDAYHADLTTPEAMYGVLALQFVLRAIAASDGTRAGVHKAILSGSGVSLPADTSLTGVPTGIVAATGDVNPPLTTVGQVSKGAVTFVSTSKLT